LWYARRGATSSLALRRTEHRIPAQTYSLALQRLLQQVVQLARADAWLTHALLAHQLHHRLRIREVIGLSAPALVVRLTAVAHMLASPLHAQPCDEFLRENLPKGFFTTRTP
jgi:hypothetical protein